MRRVTGIHVMAAILMAACVGSHAHSLPSKVVRIVVPNEAGGPFDLIGRLLAQRLSEFWSQGVIVENRPGAGSNIGVAAVAKAASDGYMLPVTNSAPIMVNQSLCTTIPYDAVRGLGAISLLASAPEFLTMPSSSWVNSVAELVRLAKAEPGKLTFSSLGNGTAPHLAGAMFKAESGIDIVHVRYQSLPEMTAALIVGEVSMAFSMSNMLAQVQAGKMKFLAVTSKTRSILAPQAPTMVEFGLAHYEMIAWYGMLAPAAIKSDTRAQLYAGTLRALGQPDVESKLMGIGFEVVGNTPEQFSA